MQADDGAITEDTGEEDQVDVLNLLSAQWTALAEIGSSEVQKEDDREPSHKGKTKKKNDKSQRLESTRSINNKYSNLLL